MYYKMENGDGDWAIYQHNGDEWIRICGTGFQSIPKLNELSRLRYMNYYPCYDKMLTREELEPYLISIKEQLIENL